MYFCAVVYIEIRYNPTNMTDKVSYALGLSIAHNFRATGIQQVDFEDFTAAMRAVFEDKKPAISPEEAQTTLNSFFERLQNQEKDLNEKAGAEYREIFKNKAGVQATETGILYEVISMGSGDKPVSTDTVEVHYTGSLIDGHVFDSSVERGHPASFPLTAVISGWTEILQLMPVGSKWRVVLPPHLAYGEQGAGQMIRPNSTLIFEIELLAIEHKQ